MLFRSRKGKEIKVKEIKEKNTDLLSGKPDDENFSFLEKLKVMFADKDRRMNIIAYYWRTKGFTMENKAKYDNAIKRELIPSQALIGYTNEEIKKTCEWLKKNADFKWTLETVHKYIDEPLDQMKTGGKPKNEDDLIKELQNKYAKH